MQEKIPYTLDSEDIVAILEGNKTVHIMPVEPQPLPIIDKLLDIPGENRWWGGQEEDNKWGTVYTNPGSDYQEDWKCPLGKIGDIIWIREDWHQHYQGNELGGHPCYRINKCTSSDNWNSAETMPEWASRLHLKVDYVMTDHINLLREADILPMGFHYPPQFLGIDPNGTAIENPEADNYHPVDAFLEDWDKKYPQYPWETNPLVWVVSFVIEHVWYQITKPPTAINNYEVLYDIIEMP